MGAASVTAGVYAACVVLRDNVAAKLGLDPSLAQFADGVVRQGEWSFALGAAAKEAELVGEDTMEYGDLAKQYVQQTFGAHFVEVAVDAITGEIRLRRMLAVCAPDASSIRRRPAARSSAA